MTPLVVVGTPCFGGLVSQYYTLSLLHLATSGTKYGYDFSATLIGQESLITRGRSSIVAMFMDNLAATHLLFVDADISFDVAQFVRMLRFDVDFVGGMYPAKVIDWNGIPERLRNGESLEEAGLVYVGEICSGSDLKVSDGFATANYAGCGFQLIKRDVFTRMFAAYPTLKFENIDTFTRRPSDNLYALFDCMIEDGTYLSEDFSFCRRWRAIGGEIWLDLRSRLTHHSGSHNYRGNAEARHRHLLSR